MSLMFNGFLMNHSTEVVNATLTNLVIELPLQSLPINATTTFLLIDLPRSADFDGNKNAAIATTLACEFGKCLVIYYDDRIGLRTAVLYNGSGVVEDFGEADEVWVPLQDNGEPDTKGQRYTSAEVETNEDPELEFDCIFDGIDAGLLRIIGLREITSVMVAAIASTAP